MVGRGKPILGDPSSPPKYTTGSGQVLSTHASWGCVFQYCVIHRPMPGPWESWPTNWNSTRRLMERVCPCGVAHPAAEEYQIHGSGALLHQCCKRCRCWPEIRYGGDFDGDVIDGEVVEPRKELGS
jgi:hypothetical protein